MQFINIGNVRSVFDDRLDSVSIYASAHLIKSRVKAISKLKLNKEFIVARVRKMVQYGV